MWVHVAVVGRLRKRLLAAKPAVDAVDTGANGQHGEVCGGGGGLSARVFVVGLG